MKKSFTVVITGIGGLVGQGVARNINRLDLPIKLIGTNIESVSTGNHMVDEVYRVPFAYEKGFGEIFTKIVKRVKADLVIPTTDYETYFLSKIQNKIGAVVAVSSPKTTGIFLDKYLTFSHFTKNGIPIAESCLPSNYDGQYGDVIVKPREGRGSRGIVINPKDLSIFNDTYIVQKLYKGKEITTAFYVTKTHKIHSMMTFERDLYSGFTAKCTVSFDYDKKIKPIIEKIVKSSPINGSCNLQSIVTADGQIVPFEGNCRISGTNSIRAHFGFCDVKWTIEEYLLGRKPSKTVLTRGSAMRVLMDVIYPDAGFDEIRGRGTRHIIS